MCKDVNWTPGILININLTRDAFSVIDSLGRIGKVFVENVFIKRRYSVRKSLLFAVLACIVFLSACGGGGGSSSGTLSMAITDAKPALPAGIVQVLVTIDEVSVHQTGGDWISLPLAQTPFTVDLLQFTNGHTTQLVPQTTLTSGKYTQVRLGVQSATIVTDTGAQIPVKIPSSNLKTAENFDFDVAGGGAIDLTVDFDVSQSLVETGSGQYQLKPVLHLVNTAEAATITGNITAATFGPETQATIIVTQDNDNSGTITPGDVEYSRLVVVNGVSNPTPFSIYWLVPGQSYIMQVQIGGNIVYTQAVPAASLPPAAVFALNSGNPI
jgi:hypothetical protein